MMTECLILGGLANLKTHSAPNLVHSIEPRYASNHSGDSPYEKIYHQIFSDAQEEKKHNHPRILLHFQTRCKADKVCVANDILMRH